jgi:hypothetical protein
MVRILELSRFDGFGVDAEVGPMRVVVRVSLRFAW